MSLENQGFKPCMVKWNFYSKDKIELIAVEATVWKEWVEERFGGVDPLDGFGSNMELQPMKARSEQDKSKNLFGK